MFEIDQIPIQVKSILKEKGYDEHDVLMGVYCDRNPEMLAQDMYIFATQKELILLGGVMSVKTDPGVSKRKTQHPIKSFTLLYERVYPFKELHSFHLDELLSAGRLTAKKDIDGESVIVFLACFTNFCRESVQIFAKYAEKLAKGEDLTVDPKDDPCGKRCPQCGMRYPDTNRPVCPRCMEKGKLFWRFSSFFLRYKGYLIMMLLSLVLLTATSILAPYLSSGFFYDEVIYGTGEFAGELIMAMFLIIGTRVLKLLANMVNNLVSANIAPRMVYELKTTIFSSIKSLSLRFFTGRQTGGLMTQVNEDANTIYSFFCTGLPRFIINIVQIAVVTVLMFLISPMLALVVLSTFPLSLLLVGAIYRKERRLHAKRYMGSSQLNSFLSNVLTGIRVVKAFSMESVEVEHFSKKNQALGESDKRLLIYNNYAWPAASMVLYLGNILAWGVGGWMVIQGTGGLTYGMLLTFVAYMNMVFEPIGFFTEFANWSADCTNAIQRLFEITDAHTDVAQAENAMTPTDMSGDIRFSHVSFSYQKGKKILDDVSFEVKDGQILGIVGHTGAGKSTLVNLLMRLYEADEGEIFVGGYPIRELSFEALHQSVAIVSQETYLFMGTLLDNIRYARPTASFDEVVSAAKAAGAHDFIMCMPDAYHTRVGFGYQELSGGERQRISIARAILKDPKILILDEATSAMDTETERRIQDALSKLIKGKTTVMIAHRLSTLRDADSLIVIEHGKIAERGTHEALLQTENGIYKKLYTLQEEALKSAGIRD